jgi:translation elongation factor EF-1alpha
MISGATQADVALLVVPAAVGEYESSMRVNAQTREHMVLLKALGVGQIIIVVNKMDMTSPPWSQDRFLSIEHEVRALLGELQFNNSTITAVPVSGISGENLTSRSEGSPLGDWYSGPTLMQALDNFREPPRQQRKPLRAIITSVVSESAKGWDVNVKVLQGIVRSSLRH